MLHTDRHNIKHRIFKIIALLVTICYMAEPEQHQISYVLHFISHNLEAPRYIIQHDTNKAQLELAKKNKVTVSHQHQVINFINTILGLSSDKDQHQGQSNLGAFGFKKKIVHQKYQFKVQRVLDLTRQDNFKIIHFLEREGYSLQLYRPPQLMSIV